MKRLSGQLWQILQFVPTFPWVTDCIKKFPAFDRYSLLLSLARYLLYILDYLTLKRILQTHLQKYCYHWWYRNRYIIVECYVFSWLVVEIIFLLRFDQILLWFIIWFFIWRLVDIFQSWFNILILSEDPSPYSVPRMLVLVMISFAEIAIIFGVLDFVWKDAFISDGHTFHSMWQSLYHSVTTITTVGSNYSPVSGAGYFLVYGEIVFSVLFLVVVIQRIVSLYRSLC